MRQIDFFAQVFSLLLLFLSLLEVPFQLFNESATDFSVIHVESLGHLFMLEPQLLNSVSINFAPRATNAVPACPWTEGEMSTL